MPHCMGPRMQRGRQLLALQRCAGLVTAARLLQLNYWITVPLCCSMHAHLIWCVNLYWLACLWIYWHV
jgi:hypothetical protein